MWLYVVLIAQFWWWIKKIRNPRVHYPLHLHTRLSSSVHYLSLSVLPAKISTHNLLDFNAAALSMHHSIIAAIVATALSG